MINLMKALLKAQKQMGGAAKGANNPYFKSKYADYGSVLEACKDPLNDNGIIVLQPHVVVDGKNYVKTDLIHADSGETYSSTTEVRCSKENDAQALGSAITYARRFGLESLLAMPREDDDGNAASGKKVDTKPSTLTKLAEVKKEEVKAAILSSEQKVLDALQKLGPPQEISNPAPVVVNSPALVQKSMQAAQKAAIGAKENPVKKQTSWS